VPCTSDQLVNDRHWRWVQPINDGVRPQVGQWRIAEQPLRSEPHRSRRSVRRDVLGMDGGLPRVQRPL